MQVTLSQYSLVIIPKIRQTNSPQQSNHLKVTSSHVKKLKSIKWRGYSMDIVMSPNEILEPSSLKGTSGKNKIKQKKAGFKFLRWVAEQRFVQPGNLA